MKITILCSSTDHPVMKWLHAWRDRQPKAHCIDIINSREQLSTGDILFLISCTEIINRDDRVLYSKTLIIHASDLPNGRGWSPLVWQVLEGRTEITVSLLEAEDAVDSGPIWKKQVVTVSDHLLHDEINAALFNAEIDLMDFAVNSFGTIEPEVQSTDMQASYYRKRLPTESELDPTLPLADQFDLIRVSDPQRYPAYFDLRGHRYKITLEKLS